MADYAFVFQSLSDILRKHSQGLTAKIDSQDNYYLERPTTTPKGKPEFFGAAQSKKSYVSYHLMPVYTAPELLDGISHELRSKMQGKSCFNFVVEDPKLFKELDALTKKCAASFK